MDHNDINVSTPIGQGVNGYLTDNWAIVSETEPKLYEIRPWGTYTILDNGAGYKVKKITMNVGASISRQFHNHRAENWVIITGVAKVEIVDEIATLYPNESVYILPGQVHKCTNVGSIPLNFIEVQTGQYLEEDDIVRLDTVSNKTFGDIL